MRARRQIWASLLLASVSIGLVGVGSASASARGVVLSPRQASAALERATRLLNPARHLRAHHAPPAEVTTTLLALSRSLSSLDPSQRRLAAGLLARPTDKPDPDGSAYAVAEHQPPFCTAHFCVHYVTTTADAPSLADANGNGIPDYVEQVGAVAEQVYSTENGTLGWRPPKPDGTLGGDSRTDIYLVDLGGQLFGYSAPDAHQKTRAQSAYLVVDNDYSPSQFPGTTPTNDLEVTLAHEYNHVLQFAYDVDQDLWLYEASAVWMEDHVYPNINDYLRYIKRWVVRTKVPITSNSIKIYGTAVWNHWLAGRYGDTIVRNFWERAPKLKPRGFSIGTINAGIHAAMLKAGRSAGRQDFSHEFALFAASTAEWRTPGDFPYVDAPLWNDVQRRGTLRPRHFVVRRLSHTGYLLFNVQPRNVSAMRLLAGAVHGTRSAFALICRQGSVEGGTVAIKMKYATQGGVRGVTLRDPGRCSRITAALINADARQHGHAFGRWRYSHDRVRFAATLLLRR
jgi:Family of unknown function (DUF6055)